MDFSTAGLRPSVSQSHLQFGGVYYSILPMVPHGKLDVTSWELQHSDIALEVAQMAQDRGDVRSTTLIWSAASVVLDFRVTPTRDPLLQLAKEDGVAYDDDYCEHLWDLAQQLLHGAALAGCLRALGHAVGSSGVGVSNFRKKSSAVFHSLSEGQHILPSLNSSFLADDAHAHFLLSERLSKAQEYKDSALVLDWAKKFLLASISYALAGEWNPFIDHRLNHERTEHRRGIELGTTKVASAIDEGLELLNNRGGSIRRRFEAMTKVHGDIDSYLVLKEIGQLPSDVYEFYSEIKERELQMTRFF